MPIEMPKGLPFSVDTWTHASGGKRHHFLTHAHMDHTQGIVARASYPIYCTSITRSIVLQYYPQLDESGFVCIEVGQSLNIEDPDGDFVVSAFDANHCPGAVMFVYEGNFGNILHTGDCRLTIECLQSLPEKYIGKKGKKPISPLDFVFLDCTFGQFPSELPSRRSAVQQIINCIWKHPDAPTVYLTCDMLGQEQILIEVSQTFAEKVYIDKSSNSKSFKNLELIAPEVVSQDPSSRFHLLASFPNLPERAEAMIDKARANFQHEPLIIRPSTQWYAHKNGTSDILNGKKERFDEAVRDMFGVWHVCYSIHSSKDELEWALQLLAPKWVVSTTPPCRAIDLDYFKQHCFGNIRSLSLVQKLWEIDVMTSLGSDETIECYSCSAQVEDSRDDSCSETQSEPTIIPTNPLQRKRLTPSPPSKRPTITLFGRARLGFYDSDFCNVRSENDPIGSVSSQRESKEAEDRYREDVKVEEVTAAAFVEADCSKVDVVTVTCESEVTEFSKTRFSRSYNENLRWVYRCKNVPVPQPLPSLAKLMEANRSLKKRIEFE